MAIKMSTQKSYYREPKTTPVFLLLDVSGSMYDENRIDNLNEATETLLKTLAKDEKPYMITAITFGDKVECFIKPTDAKDAAAQWRNMDANGMTPMGAALRMAKDMIDDDNIIKGRMYYPIVVLVSDGGPNDSWEAPLANFINSGRTQKCQRMAMGIGQGADMSVLKRFIEGMDEEVALFQAKDASEIKNFFKEVSRVSQAQSQGRSVLSSNAQEQKTGDNHGDVPPKSSRVADDEEDGI